MIFPNDRNGKDEGKNALLPFGGERPYIWLV